MKKLFIAAVCGLLCLSGCGTSKEELKEEVKQDAKASVEEEKKREEEKKAVVDEAFIEAVATGFEKRVDILRQDNFNWGKQSFVDAVDAELKEVEGFANQEFTDPELKEKATKYIDALKAQKATAELMLTDLGNGSSQWNKAVIERVEAMADFKKNYGLKVGDDYKEDFEEVIEDVGTEDLDKSKFFNDMYIEELNDNGGIPHYRVTGVNDSSSDLSNVTIMAQMEDREGNILGTMYSNPLMSVNSGQKYSFDFYGDGVKTYPSVKDMRFMYQYYAS